MENKHLRGLDADLDHQIKYNQKHGGVTDELKKRLPRPKLHPTSYFANTMGWTEESWDRVFGKKK